MSDAPKFRVRVTFIGNALPIARVTQQLVTAKMSEEREEFYAPPVICEVRATDLDGTPYWKMLESGRSFEPELLIQVRDVTVEVP